MEKQLTEQLENASAWLRQYLPTLLPDAEQNAHKLRGDGDATASRIYADAYGKDPEFYRFVWNLQSYELSLSKRRTVLLSADSPLLRYVAGPHSGGDTTQQQETPVPKYAQVPSVA